MKRSDSFASVLALVFVLVAGLGCGSLTSSLTNQKTETSNKPADTTNTASKPANTEEKTTAPANVEKADFTMTSEELDKEYNQAGVTSKDLEKYSNKNIAVTGRVTMLVTEKKGTTQPWVTLFAPGIGHGVSCYFDDENVSQMKMLKDDKMAKVQGFQDDFIVPKVSPMLKHCVVLEGAK